MFIGTTWGWYELIGSEDRKKRLVGLWLFWELKSTSATGFYLMLISGLDTELFAKALIAIEPLYDGYMPRLLEKLDQAAKGGNLERYVQRLAENLLLQVAVELGDERIEADPMYPAFFVEELACRRASGVGLNVSLARPGP